MRKLHLLFTLLCVTALMTACESSSSGSDGVGYSSLQFVYGGFDGSAAEQSGVSISNLSLAPNDLSFNYDTDLSAWGQSHGSASSALACFFVKRSDGSWVGGKFDWISSSRNSRDLSHIKARYNGWSLAGVPNPTDAAFVIVHIDGRRRSNVLTAKWQR